MEPAIQQVLWERAAWHIKNLIFGIPCTWNKTGNPCDTPFAHMDKYRQNTRLYR